MSKIEKALGEWVANGLLSEEQAQRIRSFESSKQDSSWILYGLYLLGASVVAIGLVSVIAANWNEIPGSVKLVLDFILLSAVALGVWKLQSSKHTAAFEGLLLFFLLLCLGTIGLISQVFHTGGEISQALLLWSVITCGAMLAARTYLTPFLWIPAFVAGLIFASFELEPMKTFFNKKPEAILLPVPLLIALVSVLANQFTHDSALTRAARTWALYSGLIGLGVAEIFINERFFGAPGRLLEMRIPAYVLAAVCAAVLIGVEKYSRIQKVALGSALAFYMMAFHVPRATDFNILSAVVTLLALMSLCVFFAGAESPKLFQGILALIGVRFLVLYFQAIGGLLATGFGLIASGLIVIGVGFLWNKYRVALSKWAEGWAR